MESLDELTDAHVVHSVTPGGATISKHDFARLTAKLTRRPSRRVAHRPFSPPPGRRCLATPREHRRTTTPASASRSGSSSGDPPRESEDDPDPEAARVCPGCDNPLPAGRPNQKYHDNACKQAAYRRRNKDEQHRDQLDSLITRGALALVRRGVFEDPADALGIDRAEALRLIEWQVRDFRRRGLELPPDVAAIFGEAA